jgi:hypothetical protein
VHSADDQALLVPDGHSWGRCADAARIGRPPGSPSPPWAPWNQGGSGGSSGGSGAAAGSSGGSNKLWFGLTIGTACAAGVLISVTIWLWLWVKKLKKETGSPAAVPAAQTAGVAGAAALLVVNPKAAQTKAVKVPKPPVKRPPAKPVPKPQVSLLSLASSVAWPFFASSCA